MINEKSNLFTVKVETFYESYAFRYVDENEILSLKGLKEIFNFYLTREYKTLENIEFKPNFYSNLIKLVNKEDSDSTPEFSFVKDSKVIDTFLVDYDRLNKDEYQFTFSILTKGNTFPHDYITVKNTTNELKELLKLTKEELLIKTLSVINKEEK